MDFSFLKSCQDMCNFVWQYEWRKKWHNFSDEDMQCLNESLKNDQYSVVLSDKKQIKKVTIDMKCMFKVNNSSLYEQRVRCLITDSFDKSFSDIHLITHCHVWLFQTEKSNDWLCFPPALCFLLEIACLKKKTKMYFSSLEFDLETFQGSQTIAQKTLSFSMKRENAEVNLTNGIKKITLMNESIFEKAHSQELLSIKRSLEAFATSNEGQKKQKRIPVTGILKIEDNLGVLNATENKQHTNCVAVDNECPVKKDFHIYLQGSAFSATLNQTNLQNNNNKFYIIQLLEQNSKKQYCVWRRWGRVGQKGQTNLNKYGTNLADALDEFEKKFYDKTRNNWEDKDKFVHVKGKYDLLQINLTPQVPIRKLNTPSKLVAQLHALMTLICDTQRMEEIMKEMCYDSNKTPLGELTLSQVKSGYIALNKIALILNQGGSHSELLNACNDFYTRVPHNFGMKTPPIIKTQEDIESKQRMLEALTNIRVAMNVMNSDTNLAEHPLDKYYKSLNCSLDIIEPGSPEYMVIQKCLQETHGPTHNSYTMEIIHVFKCFKPQNEAVITDNKCLFWHGSRIINWLGILKDGLRIAPPEAPRTGYMFGKGIYFADVSSKSANYCYATKRKNEGLLLISEVSVGKQYPLLEADEKMPETLPPDFNSVFAKGRVSPTDFQISILSSDAKIPTGPLVENPDHEGSLHYNEYIVYNIKQVKMKYLVWIKFNFK